MPSVRLVFLWLLATLPFSLAAQQVATGRVFHDMDGDKRYTKGEPLLPGIRVSNGREIVRTDSNGRYELPVDEDTILFVIKPKGWRTPLSDDMLPQFFYIHKPAGSPGWRFRGVAPTGPLPPFIDFPLYPNEEPEEFKAIFFGDPQPRNLREVEYNYHDVFEQLIGTDASFGVTLGDIAFDNLDTFEPQNRGIAMIGIPWYNIIGNHDLNFDSPNDQDSDETFHRVFGPNYYSFDYGNVHFIALDDVQWNGRDSKGPAYSAGLDDEQMDFIRNDLAFIPEDQMVLLMMHIPLSQIGNRGELYRLIEKRPMCISISGHTHYQEHRFIGKEDGWGGAEPHHHIINVTVCGSWWTGSFDESGIPHTTMRDGAPNGYSIMTFDGKKYDWQFFAARRPADYQMQIYAPEVLTSDDTSTEVVVNVFGGSARSRVELQVGPDSEWTLLQKVLREDPAFFRTRELEAGSSGPLIARRLPEAMISPHIWQGTLPDGLKPGTHKITVRHTDMFGKACENHRLIRVVKMGKARGRTGKRR